MFEGALVTVSGSLRSGSTTAVLVRAIAEALAPDAASVDDTARLDIELAPLAIDIATALTGGDVSPALRSALDAVEGARALIVGTPIYRGSYTGLFKSFFDLVHHDRIAGVPVLLAAGGGSDEHSLAIEHELRPLFAFFRAAVLPLGVYSRGGDYSEGRIASEALRARIAAAVAAAQPLLDATAQHPRTEQGRSEQGRRGA